MRSAIASLLFIIAIVGAPLTSFSYQLPNYVICSADRAIPSEELLLRTESKIDDIAQIATLQRLKEHYSNKKFPLTKTERKKFAEYTKLKAEFIFWKFTVDLKKSILNLYPLTMQAAARTDADTISKDVIETIYALSQKWRIGGSALIRNFMINIGAKNGGFCYQYINAIFEALDKREIKLFDLHWGVAWKDDFRENNALVITAKGGSFEDGIAVDPWRSAGKPFWTKVRGDRFPWKEEKR